MKNSVVPSRLLPPAIAMSFLLSVTAVLAQEGTDYMAEIGTTVGSGLTLAINIISAIVFVIMLWAIITKYSEANRGRATWGEVFIPFVVGAVVLGFLAVIKPDAEEAITELGGEAALDFFIPFS